MNATTTSIRVNPTWRRPLFANRHPPREPVHVDQVLALAGGHRDASPGRAAVRIEADRATPLARDFGLRGEELDLEGLRQLPDLGNARDGEFARFDVDGERGIAARGH